MDFFALNKDKIDLYFPVFTLFPFLLSVIFTGPWPVPQIIALASLRLLYLIRDRSGRVSSSDLYTLLIVLFMLSVSFVLTKSTVDGVPRILSSALLSFMVFSVLYCALDVPSIVEESHEDPYKVCEDYSLFGVGDDKDWAEYKAAIENEDVKKQQYYMYNLSQKYHPVNCPTTCRPNCAHTFSQLLSISEVLMEESKV